MNWTCSEQKFREVVTWALYYFILFISDVVKVLKFNHNLNFANDMKTFTAKWEQDRHITTSIVAESTCWLVHLNVTQFFNLTQHNNKSSEFINSFVDGTKLERKLKMKDSRVIFHTKLPFKWTHQPHLIMVRSC